MFKRIASFLASVRAATAKVPGCYDCHNCGKAMVNYDDQGLPCRFCGYDPYDYEQLALNHNFFGVDDPMVELLESDAEIDHWIDENGEKMFS